MIRLGKPENVARLLGRKPSTSRSVITARWFSGSAAIASSTVRRASPASRRSSGTPRGGALHCAAATEAVDVDRRALLVAVADERREGQRPRLAHAARLRLVREDRGTARSSGTSGPRSARGPCRPRATCRRRPPPRPPATTRTSCATRRSDGPYLSTSAMNAPSSPSRSERRSPASSSGGRSVGVRRRYRVSGPGRPASATRPSRPGRRPVRRRGSRRRTHGSGRSEPAARARARLRSRA